MQSKTNETFFYRLHQELFCFPWSGNYPKLIIWVVFCALKSIKKIKVGQSRVELHKRNHKKPIHPIVDSFCFSSHFLSSFLFYQTFFWLYIYINIYSNKSKLFVRLHYWLLPDFIASPTLLNYQFVAKTILWNFTLSKRHIYTIYIYTLYFYLYVYVAIITLDVNPSPTFWKEKIKIKKDKSSVHKVNKQYNV